MVVSVHFTSPVERNISRILFIIFLLVNSCSAARPGAALMRGEDMSRKSGNIKPYRRLYETSFQHRNHIFNFLPKGDPRIKVLSLYVSSHRSFTRVSNRIQLIANGGFRATRTFDDIE
ncbi:hypothetical protein SADUNF_Sadunf08G0093400 [Salix dunnii]|uniref:Uncharacterized protein n=1 Tax=Salix dunnii TaxID=1413687 RepID=A0A835JY39_9ROSI|nr:hypothetical protein SADUNF_Sadunf08G0093400 [Salix dunnii]